MAEPASQTTDYKFLSLKVVIPKVVDFIVALDYKEQNPIMRTPEWSENLMSFSY